MTHTNCFPTHTPSSGGDGRRSPRAPLEPGRRPSIRLISDAVVAGYLHDISQRHRDGAHASEPVRRRALGRES